MAGPSAFFPMYPADYRAKTHGLSLAEHGAYNLLIMEYWIRGEPLPDDDRILARICSCSEREWAKVSEAVRGYFQPAVINGKRVLTNKRIEEELANARGKYQRAVAGADATNRAKAEAKARLASRTASPQATATDDATADAKQPPTQNSELRTPNGEEKTHTPADAGSAPVSKPTVRKKVEYESEFDQFWKAYEPPKNSAKIEAFRAWMQTADERPPLEDLLAAVRAHNAWIAEESRKRKSEQPKKLAETWLRKQGWQPFMTPTLTPEQVEANKDRGDRLMRRGKYAEAI